MSGMEAFLPAIKSLAAGLSLGGGVHLLPAVPAAGFFIPDYAGEGVSLEGFAARNCSTSLAPASSVS